VQHHGASRFKEGIIVTPTTTRSEHDLLGDREVPASVYWGIHTLRALENYPISGKTIGSYPELVRALALVKQAATRANQELGQLDATRSEAIQAACRDIAEGRLHDQFVVDVIQGGAGTSTNMNANEVIANLALEKLGWPRGHYKELHPLNHVNMSQSTNDVYPTALKLAVIFAIQGLLGASVGADKAGRRAEGDVREDFKKHASQLDKYQKFCKKKGEQPADVALAWLLANPVVTSPIIGPRTLEQLTGSLRALKIKFTKADMQELDAIWPGPGGEAPEAFAW
jgi:hypothetical protein